MVVIIMKVVVSVVLVGLWVSMFESAATNDRSIWNVKIFQ